LTRESKPELYETNEFLLQYILIIRERHFSMKKYFLVSAFVALHVFALYVLYNQLSEQLNAPSVNATASKESAVQTVKQ
jgi:hypothetical protein